MGTYRARRGDVWGTARVYMAKAKAGEDARKCVMSVETFARRVRGWREVNEGGLSPYLVRIEQLSGQGRQNEAGDWEHVPAAVWELERFAPSALAAWASGVELAARDYSDERGYSQVVSVGPVIDPRST